jgi:2'-5' RNA ligase
VATLLFVDLRAGRTAVVVEVPAAQGLAEHVRAEFGPDAAVKIVPHVTVLYPWLDADEITPADLAGLAAVAAGVPAFEVVLDRFAWFPGVLWLAPEPADPFVRLTRGAALCWPHTPPYGGAHAGVTPHVTVMDLEAAGIDVDDEIALKDAVERLEPWTPVVDRAVALSVLRYDGDRRCTRLAEVPLG